MAKCVRCGRNLTYLLHREALGSAMAQVFTMITIRMEMYVNIAQ